MKTFDLEAALQGAKVVTREGVDVTIIRFDEELEHYPVVAQYISDNVRVVDRYTPQGFLFDHGEPTDNDLMMATDEEGNYIYAPTQPDKTEDHVESPTSPQASDDFRLGAQFDAVRVNWSSEALTWLSGKTQGIYHMTIYSDLLFSMATKDTTFITNRGVGVPLKPLEAGASANALGKKWGFGRKVMTRLFKEMEQLGLIKMSRSTVSSIATMTSVKGFDTILTPSNTTPAESEAEQQDAAQSSSNDGVFEMQSPVPSEASRDDRLAVPCATATPPSQASAPSDGDDSAPCPGKPYCMDFGMVLQLMNTTYLAKNHDYGNSFDESLDKYGLIAAIVRMSDKLNRLHTLSEQEAQVVSESLADTALDLANYAAMTCLYIKNREHHED